MSQSVPLSFTPASNIGHQSIGKNGSFWLPPKTQISSFQSHLNNYQSSKTPPPSSSTAHGGVAQKFGNQAELNSKSNPPPNLKAQLPKSIAPNHFSDGKSLDTPFLPKEVSIIKSIKSNLRSLNSLFPQKGSGASQGDVVIFAKNQTPTTQSKTPNLPVSDIRRLVFQVELALKKLKARLEHKKGSMSDKSPSDGSGTGTKNAPSGFSEKFLDTKFATNSLNRERSDLSDLHFCDSFSETILFRLLPKLGRDSQQESEIIRFSYDLPNQEQVTFRMECSKQNIDVSVICESHQNYPWLKDSLSALFAKLQTGLSTPFSLQFFNSFDDFDRTKLLSSTQIS